jgi:tellurite resistance-related uncharacterized protein
LRRHLTKEQTWGEVSVITKAAKMGVIDDDDDAKVEQLFLRKVPVTPCS